MTTIAYRDGILAGDTEISNGGTSVGRLQKIWRNEKGELLGVSGTLTDITSLRDWFLDGCNGRPPQVVGDSNAILVSPRGRIHSLFGGVISDIEAEFYAVGSGKEIAIGAMGAGAGAEHAVKIACIYDHFTSGEVKTVRLMTPEEIAAIPKQPRSLLAIVKSVTTDLLRART